MRRLLLTLVLVLAALPIQAGTIAVTWDPVTHPNLLGYRVYSGAVSGTYSHEQAVQGVSAVVPVLNCQPWFVAVKAVASTTDPEDDDGLIQSVNYSNEISGWSAPSVASVIPRQIKTNRTQDITIVGMNYQAGASLSIAGAVVTNVSVLDCSTISARVDPRSAPLGMAMVTVTNPGGSFGTANAVEFYQGSVPPPDVGGVSRQ